jgi:adenylate cyclase
MKPATKRSLVVLAICVVCTTVFTVLWVRGFVPLQEMELFARDWQTRIGRKTPMDDRLVLIGIDKPIYSSDFSNEELQKEPVLRDLQKNFPWSREVWARLIEKLGDAGAKVIVFDLVFAAQSDGDDQLKQALEKYKDHVVIGYDISESKTDRGNFAELDLPNASVITAVGASPVQDDRLGYVNVWADFDGVLRRADYRKTGEQVENLLPPDVVLESLDARALRKFGRPDLVPHGFSSRLFRYTAPPGSRLGFEQHSIGDVLSPKLWEKNYQNGKFFKGKIVLIGPTAEIFHDEHDTPFADPKRQMPGPEIHLNIINAALHGEFLNEPSLFAQALVIIMAGVCALALCFLVSQPLKRFSLVILLTAAYWVASYFIFNRSGTGFNVLLVSVPTIVLASISITVLTYDYLLERLEKRRVRKTLERYVSRDVVKELLDNPQTYFNAVGGVRRSVAILFSDVRNFTTMTESADPQALVKQLNEYLQQMVKIVFEHSGSLDKFIGDAVMAVWGNIKSSGAHNDARNAVATALAMHKALARLNADWKARGIQELAIGIGINYGEAIVGEMGSSEKVEFTAIGDPVNLASRLEGLTKEFHLNLLLGENMAPLVGDTYILRTVSFVQVKGKTKPVDVFTVMGDGAAQTVSMPMWLARYEEGVRMYRQRNFSEAAAAFEESLRQKPDDYLSSMYLQDCKKMMANPPDESWDAVLVMTKK